MRPGSEIVVERVNGDHSGCHVLVLSAPDAVPTTPGTLTIGRNDEFLDGGGMIALGVAGKRMVFDINLDALREQRLEISSEVLDLARSVR